MNQFNKSELLELIKTIAPGKATAENESDNQEKFLENFLPVSSYRHVLELNNILILGGRGVGKTELFRLLAIPSGRKLLIDNLNISSLPPLEQTTWVTGFGRIRIKEKRFPTPEVIENRMQNSKSLEWRSFWLGLILGVIVQYDDFILQDFLKNKIDTELVNLLKNDLSLLSKWWPMVIEDFENINNILDQLDEELFKRDHWLFITYDELDRLVASHGALATPIRELLSFWLDRWRRWERIRPKIFLRNDLFREEFLGFPDASKLKAHQVQLEWQKSWLYQLLVKRLANSGEEMRKYLAIVPQLIYPSETELGWQARLEESMFEELIEKMIGKYMGATPKKGITYRWIPNHLQDAGGRIVPRSFLKLFALAAENKQGEANSDTALLSPSSLQGALMETSEDRIKELAQEEYPWLESLKTSLMGLEVPMTESRFLEVIEYTKWLEQKPPATTAKGILQYLLQLGIVESRADGRINMPEIYLYGFQVKRRGGVKRPK